MTRHRGYITRAQQVLWWKSQPDSTRAFLYLADSEAVGFGLVRYESAKWWGTLGVRTRWRSKGIGTAIYRHLIASCKSDLWIEIRADNIASLIAAKRAGFRVVEEGPDLHLLVAELERP